MRFKTFGEFKKAWPKEATLMEDPDASTFIKEMRKKVEAKENLTPRMRSTLSKIANEKELSKTLTIPEIGTRVAFACEIVQLSTDNNRDQRRKRRIMEFRTRFGMRGRLQVHDDDADELIKAVQKAGMEDEDDKGSFWIEVDGMIVWKKETFVILHEIRETFGTRNVGWGVWNVEDPPHSGMLRRIPNGSDRFETLPSDSIPEEIFIDEDEAAYVESKRKIVRTRKPAKDRAKPENETEQLQQEAEDAADNWENALDF